MVRVRVNGRYFSIPDQYIEYSPYLSGAMSTGRRLEERDFIVINKYRTSVVANYLAFLRGDDFTMTREDEDFFQFMGHPNDMEYPLDYWKLKLRTRWIRENFYKYNLKERDNGFYGLVEVPLRRELISVMTLSHDPTTGNRIEETYPYDMLDRSLTIAGGFALFLSGHADTFSDVDIFPMDKDVAVEFAKLLPSSLIKTATVTANSHLRYIEILTGATFQHTRKLQIVKREFSSPSEIVYGFDIDCSGFILVKDRNNIPRLYATEIALYSVTNREIWFDMEFTEDRYYRRLAKYAGKGFQLRLPFTSIENLNVNLLRIILSDLIINQGYKPIVKTGYGKTIDVFANAMYLAGAYNHLIQDEDDESEDLGETTIGTLLMAIAYLGVTSRHKEMTRFIDMILPGRSESGEYGDKSTSEYGDEGGLRSTVDEWVQKNRMNLREPYPSASTIHTLSEYLFRVRECPLYIPA